MSKYVAVAVYCFSVLVFHRDFRLLALRSYRVAALPLSLTGTLA